MCTFLPFLGNIIVFFQKFFFLFIFMGEWKKNAFIRVNFNLFLFLQLAPLIYWVRHRGFSLLASFFVFMLWRLYCVCVLWYSCSLSLSFFLSVVAAAVAAAAAVAYYYLGSLKPACLVWFGLVAHSQHNSFFLFLSLFRSLVLSFSYTIYYDLCRHRHIYEFLYTLQYFIYVKIHTHITSHRIA